MLRTIYSTVAIAALASILSSAAALAAPVITADAASSSVVEAKRETCWRTNRTTKQKFRIC